MAAGRMVPYSVASRSMSSASRPVTAAARSGVHSATCAASSSKPSVCAAIHSWSSRSSRTNTCIIASISATSVPGSGWRNQSAESAVMVRMGSITTTCAPSRRAASITGHRCRLVSRVLVAHRMISFEWRISLGSSALPVPLVAAAPAPAVRPHSAPEVAATPRWFHRRSPKNSASRP